MPKPFVVALSAPYLLMRMCDGKPSSSSRVYALHFFCSFFFLSFLFAFFLFPLFGSHNIQYYAMPYHAILSLPFLSMQSSAQAGKRNSLPTSLPPQPSFSCCLNPIFPFLHLYLLRAMCLATKANLYLLHVNRPRVTLASSMYYLTF